MKNFLIFLITTLGLSSNAFANCFEEVEKGAHEDDQRYEEAKAYCFVDDLRQLNEMKSMYSGASVQEKYELIKRYDQVFNRLKDNGYGDIFAASSVYCGVCSGEH